MFPAPWSESHREIINNVDESVSDGTGSATAAPRGEGKSTVLFGMSIALLAMRRLLFPVVVNWKHQDGRRAMRAWLQILSGCPLFCEDYPELTQPFEVSTHATRLKSLTWADTEQPCGAIIDTMDKIIILPDSIGAIAVRSAQGDAKGLNAPLADGSIIRPDFVLFDDAQDPNRAGNPAAVAETVDRLENIFLGMAGPQKRLKAAAACTVEREGDVSCHWLNHAGWKTVRVSRIKTWPGGESGGDWPMKSSHPQRQAWDEWWRLHNGDGPSKARTYFKKNCKLLCDGMTVSWMHRFDKDHDVCALDAAMRDYYNMGPDVFSRAQQNAPIKQGVDVYTITPEIVQARVDKDRPACVVPEWVTTIVAATDMNPSYALTTVVCGFGRDQTAAVLWYGQYRDKPLPVTKDMTPAQHAQIVYEALGLHGRQLAGLGMQFTAWIGDIGGDQWDPGLRFAQESGRICGIQMMGAAGRNSVTYKPFAKNVIRRFENGAESVDDKRRRYILWNTDPWQESMQKAWTCLPGAPGSCSLFAGHHREFAEQVTRETLKKKGISNITGRMEYVWNRDNFRPHDYQDCMGMCYMGAAWRGIGTQGVVTARPRYIEQRRCKRERDRI